MTAYVLREGTPESAGMDPARVQRVCGLLDGWVKSSHRSVASCNDCHTPHNFLGKYATKATNGFFHSLAFTTGRYPNAIEIKDRNRRVTEAACRRCHENVVLAMDGPHQSQKVSCLRCHATVGHM